jgi:hypothetical protein
VPVSAGAHPDHYGGTGGPEAAYPVAQRRLVAGALDQGVYFHTGLRERLLGDVYRSRGAGLLGHL